VPIERAVGLAVRSLRIALTTIPFLGQREIRNV
jgi:hypothetical protein